MTIAEVADNHVDVDGCGSAVVVSYGLDSLEVPWLPAAAHLVVVHNDDLLDRSRVSHKNCTHLYPGTNVGFGAAVNIALTAISTSRVVLVNPDVLLTRAHWELLSAGGADDVRTIPLQNAEGTITVTVSDYPNALVAISSGLRLGRWVRLGSKRRHHLMRLLRRSENVGAITEWPLSQKWASGAVVSFPAGPLRIVGGFDSGYFLYLEDLDLCQRLASRFPDMRLSLTSTEAGFHAVGGTVVSHHERQRVERIRLESWRTYVGRQSGSAWRLVAVVLGLRARHLERVVGQSTGKAPQ